MKYFLIFFTPFSFALTNPEFFSSSLIDLEQIIEKSKEEKVYQSKTHTITPSGLAALTDQKNLIPDDFTIPPYFKDSVYFWFSIYTQYSSKQVVIHDKDDLAIIYRVLDFKELHESELSIFSKYKLQNQLAQENVVLIKKALIELSMGRRSKSKEAEDILKILTTNNMVIPKKLNKKRVFFKKLATNLRTQTGQKNMIYRGIINAELYLDFLNLSMEKFKIPNELTGIAFLESSFNYKAVSRIGASGIWQFMPYISNLFMPPIEKNLDYRSNPVISSLAAFHLLRQNKFILKRWDLAVAAYNSGTKHLVLARRKFKKVKDVSLDYILKNYNHPHLGFASQNFYSEFLALVHALDYKSTFFNIDGNIKSGKFKSQDINIYVSRCRFNLNYLSNKFNKNILVLNPQFDNPKSPFAAGNLIVSDRDLPNEYFFKLPDSILTSKYPKFWKKDVTLKKCNLL